MFWNKSKSNDGAPVEMSDAPDTSVIQTTKGSYFAIGLIIALGAGGIVLINQYGGDVGKIAADKVSSVMPAQRDYAQQNQKKVKYEMPPVPADLANEPDPNREKIAELQQQIVQMRELAKQMRMEIVAAKRETANQHEVVIGDRYKRFRGDHVMTIDYSSAPTAQTVADTGDSKGHGLGGFVPEGAIFSQRMGDLDMWITKGTQIPILPITPINTEVGGMMIGKVDEDIYSSQNGRCLLIPKNSKALAKVSPTITKGGRLIQITGTEILTPDGQIVYTDSQIGNSVGQPGVLGEYDGKFGARFGMPLFLALLSIETGNISNSRGDAIGSSVSDLASIVLEETLNIKPTAYIPQTGQVVTLTVTEDWNFRGTAKCR